MSEITPEGISQQTFRSSFRGFDSEEVRSFLREISQAVAELVSERDQLRMQLGTTSGSDMKAELEQVGREVATVLETAREAAESMRERAAAEAARWRSEAIAECEGELRQAREDAEHLRSDAWATAEELLKQSEREASRLVDTAKSDSLRLQGESEREAHKVTSSARRQADELIRNARMEAERLMVSAQAKHDEIIETANRLAETAQERTRALEQRRDELKEELDTVRQAMSSLEAAMDERREAMGLSPAAEPIQEPSAAKEEWVPGETVRVVRPEREPTEPSPAAAPVESISMSTDIKVIPADELVERLQSQETPAAESTDDEESPDDLDLDSVGEEVSSELDSPETEAASPNQQSFDELTGLFDKLRHGGEPSAAADDPGDAPSDDGADSGDSVETGESEPDAPEGPDSAVASAGESTEPPVTAEEAAAAPTSVAESPDIDPFELRDQLLLPVSNRALRNLKRQLAEEGNLALEELHLEPEHWMPDAGDVKEKVRADLVVLHAESFGAGHAAVEQLTDERLTRPPTPRGDVATDFATELTADLEHVLEEGRHAGQGALQLKAGVSRVFRAWRTDESERRMRTISIAAFNEGVMATVQQNEMGEVRWVLSGRGCAVCRSSAGEIEGDGIPPAHDGCECLITPV